MKPKRIDECHSFNIHVACITGERKAILLKEIYGWCTHNLHNGKNIFAGVPWTYNSAEAFQDKFCYWKSRSISRWLVELENEGWLYSSDVFNKFSIDKTKWYTIHFEMYDHAVLGEKLPISQIDKWKAQIDKWMSENGKSRSAKKANENSQNGEAIPSSTISKSTKTTSKEKPAAKAAPLPDDQEKKESPTKGKKVAATQNLKIELSEIEIENHMKIILDRIPEANIQAEFYHLCRNKKVNCILEYTCNGSRFDAVVYDNKKNAIVIVEFKSYKTRKQPKTKTKQLAKYKEFNLPIVMITRMEDVEWGFSECLKYLPNLPAKPAPTLHTKARDRFDEWKDRFAPDAAPIYWDAKENGSLKNLLNRLKDAASKKGFVWQDDEEFLQKVFDVFCRKFTESNQWYADCFVPSQIVSKWNVILQTLHNNGKRKKRQNNGITAEYEAQVLADLRG